MSTTQLLRLKKETYTALGLQHHYTTFRLLIKRKKRMTKIHLQYFEKGHIITTLIHNKLLGTIQQRFSRAGLISMNGHTDNWTTMPDFAEFLFISMGPV